MYKEKTCESSSLVIVRKTQVFCLHTTETDGAPGYTTAVHSVLPVRLASVLQIRNRLRVGHTL